MNLAQYIGGQFGRPTGPGGVVSTWVMNRINRRQYRAVLEHLRTAGSERVLDIGFGNGFLLRCVNKAGACRLYGIEISEDMLALAHRRNRKAIAQGGMRLEIGDVTKLNFSDGYFACAYTVNTVYFWSDLDRGMAEIFRVLRPGGKFIHAFYSKRFLDRLRYTDYGFQKYTPEELCRASERAGFHMERLEELKRGLSYCLVLSK